MPLIRAISVSGSIPTVTQLALGDLAINTFDGKAYIKKYANNTQTIIELGSGGASVSASYALSSSYSDFSLTASYALQALSASYAPDTTFPYTGSALITGSLGLTGSLSTTDTVFLKGLINQTSPQNHVVVFDNTTGRLYITASSAFGGGGGGGSTPGGNFDTIQYNNAGVLDGSDNFKLVGGNSVYLTGSLLVTGSSIFIGPVTASSFTGSFTGSLSGTSSWAENALNSNTASYVELAQTASYVLQAVSSSFSSTASYVELAQTASYVETAQTASYVLQAVSASYATTASYADRALSSSYSTNSLLLNSTASTVFATTGSNLFRGDQNITGSVSITGSLTVSGPNADVNLTATNIVLNAGTLRAPLLPVSSPPGGALLNTVLIDALNGTLYVTSSLPGTGGGGTAGPTDRILTGSITASVADGTNPSNPNFFLIQSGSVEMLKFNTERVMVLETRTDTPTAVTGAIFYSASGDFFFGTL